MIYLAPVNWARTTDFIISPTHCCGDSHSSSYARGCWIRSWTDQSTGRVFKDFTGRNWTKLNEARGGSPGLPFNGARRLLYLFSQHYCLHGDRLMRNSHMVTNPNILKRDRKRNVRALQPRPHQRREHGSSPPLLRAAPGPGPPSEPACLFKGNF